MSYVKVGAENGADIEIYYEDHGQGRPVVLIHGYPLDAHSWERQHRVLLQAGHRVISYDRRGFGRSGQPTVGYDYDTFAADLKAALLGAVPPFLLKTPDNPQGVDGQVFDGIKNAIIADRYTYFESFFNDFYNVDKLAPERISDRAWQAGFNVAAGASPFATYACVDTWLTDFRGDLPKIDVPTLLVHGNADRILPYEATAKRLPGLIENLRFVTVDGGPHNIAWTHADEVNKALLEFIDG
jgi:non-heme chloroperoxidase